MQRTGKSLRGLDDIAAATTSKDIPNQATGREHAPEPCAPKRSQPL